MSHEEASVCEASIQCMSPTLNEIQCVERSDTIEILDGIMFIFYPELQHLFIVMNDQPLVCCCRSRWSGDCVGHTGRGTDTEVPDRGESLCNGPFSVDDIGERCIVLSTLNGSPLYETLLTVPATSHSMKTRASASLASSTASSLPMVSPAPQWTALGVSLCTALAPVSRTNRWV